MPSQLSTALKEQLDKVDDTKEYTGCPPRISSTSGRTYYVKEGSGSEAEQWVGEVKSLKAIEAAAPGIAPHVYAHGTLQSGRPYMISEYKDFKHLTTSGAVELAKRMATEVHQLKSLHGFGFEVPTYCGATRFENGWHSTWEKCYGSMYQHLVDSIRKKGGYNRLCDIGDQVVKEVIPGLLGHLVIQPVLLHGDLWSGNVGVETSTKQPIIYDPASFYGHNEADLAISRMFGGFPEAFFTTYFEYNPKTEPVEEFPLRCQLYESFHYLNHTLIFGGHYGQHAEKMMSNLVEEMQKRGKNERGKPGIEEDLHLGTRKALGVN
ncbi:fructosamine kinase PKL/CAK/FruK [Coprinopsis sp. MPI-PUGE-AT-0042]|nr:fructosamine kinase PKL/CAK/FruK [Coprinopsis sp. MPI-PUGE-AT-0042]